MFALLIVVVLITTFICIIYVAYRKHIGYARHDIPTSVFNAQHMNIFNQYDRFLVVGCPASGKSTLCRQICTKYPHLHHIELDKCYWGKNWSHPNKEHFKAIIQLRMKRGKHQWIADGNYGSANDILWGNAQVVIWLEYEFWEVLYRGCKRTLKRLWTQEQICGENHETLSVVLTNGIPYWIWKCHARFKHRIPALHRQYPLVKLIKIPSPRHCQYWLDNLIV